MKRLRLTAAGRLAATLLIGASLVAGCASKQRGGDKEPTIHLDKTWEITEPTGCNLTPGKIDMRRGRVPANATTAVRLELRSDRPSALELFESILAQWAARHCVPAVTLLRAEVADGAEGVERVVAVGFIPADGAKDPSQGP